MTPNIPSRSLQSLAMQMQVQAERTVDDLIDAVAASVDKARAVEEPFYHIEFDSLFPEDLYASIIAAMPVYSDYRAMSGRSRDKNTSRPPTRVKIDLFPEYIAHLSEEKRAVWQLVGKALCSEPVKNAFRRRLAPALERRFGQDFANVGMFPIPILTRDIPGYNIRPHTDTVWKGITVQIYLPADDLHTNIGTIFHSKLPDGSLPKKAQMRFAPNCGYAFAVGDDTWHSADTVGPEVTTRDSILLTYFVDAGILRFMRNRFKRVGNFLLNEFRHYSRPLRGK